MLGRKPRAAVSSRPAAPTHAFVPPGPRRSIAHVSSKHAATAPAIRRCAVRYWGGCAYGPSVAIAGDRHSVLRRRGRATTPRSRKPPGKKNLARGSFRKKKDARTAGIDHVVLILTRICWLCSTTPAGLYIFLPAWFSRRKCPRFRRSNHRTNPDLEWRQ